MSAERKPLIAAGGALLLIIAGAWLFGVWRYANPRYSWQEVETDTYSASVPSHWKWTRHDSPKLDRRYMSFERVPSESDDPQDKIHWELTVKHEGKTDASTLIGEIRRHGDKPSEIQELILQNGVRAKTWTHLAPMGELSMPVRWFVFEGSNGSVYSASYDVPRAWKARWRYANVFQDILASMKFKYVAATPKPR